LVASVCVSLADLWDWGFVGFKRAQRIPETEVQKHTTPVVDAAENGKFVLANESGSECRADNMEKLDANQGYSTRGVERTKDARQGGREREHFLILNFSVDSRRAFTS
jgi:hypothetical protein